MVDSDDTVRPARGDRPDHQSRSRRDRAQLLLVGSIAVAFVIVGLVVVINTVLFTESVATSESVSQSEEAAQFDFEARKNVRSLILRLNHYNRTFRGPRIADYTARNVSNYSRLLAESYATRGPMWVNISYRNDTTDWGRKLVKGEDSEFTGPPPSSANDWQPVPESPPRDVGRFIVNLNVSETSTSPVYVNITNATGEYVNVSMNATEPGINANISVNSTRSIGPNSTTECDPSNGRVLIDMLEGEVFTGECSFNATEGLEEPYSINVTNGTNGYGKFSIVVNGSVDPSATGTPDYNPCTPGSSVVCSSPAIWNATARVAFESDTVRYTQSHNVTIYP